MTLDTISVYGIDIFADMDFGREPMTPEAAKIFGRRFPEGPEVLPSTHCLPLSFPMVTSLSELSKIVQTPSLTVIMLELNNSFRQIYSDGRKLPVDPSPTWLGYSVGHWEGDVFVVESSGFRDEGWLDVLGHPHSDQLKITERYHRRDFGHMDIEMTFEDRKMYTKPLTIKVTHELQPDTDILEYVCLENEKDKPHMGLK